MLRQNAHEKAFEIKVTGQREFERKKKEKIMDGRKKVDIDQKERITKLNLELNISKSKAIN